MSPLLLLAVGTPQLSAHHMIVLSAGVVLSHHLLGLSELSSREGGGRRVTNLTAGNSPEWKKKKKKPKSDQGAK